MSELLKQSTAATVTVGPILDADGVAVTTAVVGNLKLSKNGGVPAALNASATLTHRATGHYSLALTASDADTVGTGEVIIDATTNAMPTYRFRAIEPAVYDALFADAATGMLPANVIQWLGTAPLALSSQQVQAVVPNTQKVDVETIKTQAVTLAGGVTIPAATLASTVNITAGTVTTTTNLTNLPTIPANWITTAGITDGAFTAAKFAAGAFDAVWTVSIRTLTAFDASFKTGYALSSAGVQAIWDALTSALTTVNSIGKLLVDNINTTISSRASQTSVDDVPTNAEFAATFPSNFAALGINVSGHVSRVVLVDTLTTYTGNTPQTGDSFARIGATGSGLTSLAQASVVTESRLAELDAANLPADVDQLKGDNPNRPTRTVQFDLPPFMMVDSTDGFTPETGITVTATISKDGGAFAACANAVSEISGGFYAITLTATEMTATRIALKFTGSGCRQTNISFATQPT